MCTLYNSNMTNLSSALSFVAFVLLLPVLFVGFGSERTPVSQGLTPVILIPGHGGNQMQMNLDRNEPIRPGCKTSTHGWVNGWLHLWNFLPGGALDCWVEHYKLVFNPDTKRYSDVEGVSQRVPGWGQVESMEYIDPSYTAYILGNIGAYFAPLINKLEHWGYERGVNLRGAPYDFRYSPYGVPNFYEPLKELVVKMYEENGNARVSLVSHSMGGLMAYYFLNKQTSEWRKKYIHSMVTMNTPWKGTVSMAEAMISGYTWGFDGMYPNTFRTMQRTCESGVYLLPSSSEWQGNVVQTPDRNYTASDYLDLFHDMGYPAGQVMWNEVKEELRHLKKPEVDTWCFYSSGKPTPEVLVYGSGKFPDGPPQRIAGDGDGSVNIRSANACRVWLETDDNLIRAKEFKDVSHNGIFSSSRLHSALREIFVA